MGLDYTTEVGYGFFKEGESADDLLKRLGLEGYVDGLPTYSELKGLGFPGLGITQRLDNTSRGDWAIFIEDSHLHLSPKYDDSQSYSFEPETLSAENLERLIELRDRLFPKGGKEDQPVIGWFLLASVW